jgi:hypothetical protein
MNPNWTTALKASISDTLGTMFFAVVEEDKSLLSLKEHDQQANWLLGWVVVKSGDQAIKVWTSSPYGLGKELAANLLSLDEDELSPEDLDDAYRELLNMVVGGLLTNVDTHSQWKMGLPEVVHLKAGMLSKTLANSEQSLAYDVEGHPLLAGWLDESE